MNAFGNSVRGAEAVRRVGLNQLQFSTLQARGAPDQRIVIVRNHDDLESLPSTPVKLASDYFEMC